MSATFSTPSGISVSGMKTPERKYRGKIDDVGDRRSGLLGRDDRGQRDAEAQKLAAPIASVTSTAGRCSQGIATP